MLNIAIKNKPNFVCIVPERRKELTTEGGLNLRKNKKFLKDMIFKLKKSKIRIKINNLEDPIVSFPKIFQAIIGLNTSKKPP